MQESCPTKTTALKMRLRVASLLGVQRSSSASLPVWPSLPGLPALLRLLFVFFAAAGSAHALPSRRTGGGGGLLPNSAAEAATRGEGRQDGLDAPVEPDPLPPAPSEELLARLYRRNVALRSDYPFWNLTDLDTETCRQLAANETAAKRTADEDASCISVYSCNYDRFRYPHWLVFTICSRGPGPCDPEGRPEDEWQYSCYPYEEKIQILRYEDISRTTPNSRRSTGGTAARAAGGDDLLDHEYDDKLDEVESEVKGEWQLRSFWIPADCLCYE